ncbi:acylcarnitine hydrolase [Daktulosphaira vitifoliae]|uniref:acylcarnitine hydrolase n=1 Tax=Daktulosphaira vitifoliae TaxID=58002 RepID=UPI0021A9A998|nr:acylcarnitine hydrolase [Daktulosphaira vitifoliae]
MWFSLLILLVYLSNSGGQRILIRDAPPVTIRRQGVTSGVEVTLSKIGHRAWMYLGLPFAQPPVGNLRFAPPNVDPLPAWSGIRNGSVHMPSCMQDPQMLHNRNRVFEALMPNLQIRMSEDCLYLNVYRPEGAIPDEKFPVMVWFHPGDFHSGSPSLWDASVLAAKQKVIVVTTAYRLNIFGFYSDSSSEASGNWGLLDQVAALDWVNQNIDSFGGSSQNVTIFGQGSGAVCVGLHTLSPLSRGKFQRAISMGGNVLQRIAITTFDTETVLEMLADNVTCFRNTLTGCLKNIVAEELYKQGGMLTHWGPVVDAVALANGSRDPFLPDEPGILMAADGLNPAAHMIGFNHMEEAYELYDKVDAVESIGVTRDRFENLIREMVDEEQLPGGQLAPMIASEENCTLNVDFVLETVIFRYGYQANDPENLRGNYVKLATNKKYGSTAFRMAIFTSKRSPTYMYRFEYKLRTTKVLVVPEWIDAAHMMELPFVWGMPFWTNLQNIDWSSADRRMSENMMNMWTNFARFSNPTFKGFTVKWEEFKGISPKVMVLDKNLNLSFPDQEYNFWADYYPKVLNVAMQCCQNVTTDGASISSLSLVFLIFVPLLLYSFPIDLIHISASW